MKADIKYLKVYSDTMENDKHGRWQRKAMACGYNIALIQKIKSKDTEVGFIIRYNFPVHHPEHVHYLLSEAKKQIEKDFNQFLEDSFSNLNNPLPTL